MLLLALTLSPLCFAALAFVTPSERFRPKLLPLAGAIQLVLVIVAIQAPEAAELSGWIQLDRLGKLVLGFVTVLFFLCTVYAVGYLALRPERPNRIFCASLMAFLAMISLATESHHLGLMWVALETLTLTSAPLVYFNRNPRSLEATWKYLLIGSVGIAIALLGSFFLAYSGLQAGLVSSLLFEDLLREAPQLSRPWLHAAFILLFVGYGTKMGLAPMHTWKPDAYGEAPGLVGVLLAGCVTSCAFLAILRFFQICRIAGEAAFAQEIMVFIGLSSMIVAGVFMIRQSDYKRMLAYSSVEHMGILVLGIGIGGGAVFGALFHLVNNAMAKGVMFLSAGNIHRAFGSKNTQDVSGALRKVPLSAGLFLAGFFAVTGSPPFSPFVSEFTILRAAISGGHVWVAALFLVALAIVFIGMGSTVLAVVQGEPGPQTPEKTVHTESFLTVFPIAAFMSIVCLLGVYLPPPLEVLLRDAARFIEAGP
jgi:hydrogenase-4 component F